MRTIACVLAGFFLVGCGTHAGGQGDGGAGNDGGIGDDGGGGGSSASRVSAGDVRACAIRSGGALECWGDQLAPATVASGSAFLDVSVAPIARDTAPAPGFALCAVRSDGALMCGNLDASGSALTLTRLDTQSYAHVSIGDSYGCALTSAGTLYCWGTNNAGQLGVGDDSDRPTPTQVGTDTDWASVVAMRATTCAIKQSGALYCWGNNLVGAIGTTSPTPQLFPGGASWVSVSGDGSGACGIRSDGALVCWGAIYALPQAPTQVGKATDWARVSVFGHVCGIKHDGTLWCLGSDSFGEFGQPGDVATAPVQVGTDDDWGEVAAGQSFTCFSKTNGNVYCAGRSSLGQTGQPPPVHATPTPIGNAGDWSWAAVGWNDVVARKSGSAKGLSAWGADAPSGIQTPVPSSSVSSSTAYASASVSMSHACAVSTAGAISCWGDDSDGELGTNLTFTARTVAAGYDSTCAIDTSGNLYCWGQITGSSSTPTAIGTGTTWTAVAVSRVSACAIASDASLWCWGGTFGTVPKQQMSAQPNSWTAISGEPDESFDLYVAINAGTPYYFSGDTNYASHAQLSGPGYVQAAVAGSHSCGVKTDGTLWCVGDNFHGELGNGTTMFTTTPVQVNVGGAATTDWQSVSLGNELTCAMRAGGALYCWGANDVGQIGDGTAWVTSPRLVP